jgi:hypothetical protein
MYADVVRLTPFNNVNIQGEQDFSSFRNSGCQSSTPIRNVLYIKIDKFANFEEQPDMQRSSPNAITIHKEHLAEAGDCTNRSGNVHSIISAKLAALKANEIALGARPDDKISRRDENGSSNNSNSSGDSSDNSSRSCNSSRTGYDIGTNSQRLLMVCANYYLLAI